MSSLVQRECNSDKNCSSCDKPIMKGQQYMAGPYKALCLECHEIEKKEFVSPSKKATDDYIVSGSKASDLEFICQKIHRGPAV